MKVTCKTCGTVVDNWSACTWTDGKAEFCSEACARSPKATS